MDQRLVLLDMLMIPQDQHPDVYKFSVLIDAEDEVITLLFAHYHHQLYMLKYLI